MVSIRVLYPGQIEMLEMLVVEERGKPENPEKNPQSKDENQQQTQPTYGVGPESSLVFSPLCQPSPPCVWNILSVIGLEIHK